MSENLTLQFPRSEVAGKFECADEKTINDPVSDDRLCLGTYETPEEAIRCSSKGAVLDTKMKRAEFEEKFMGKEDVKIVEDEPCDGVSLKTKQFNGVNKKGNKWQARIRDPKTKFKLHLGYFSSPEEAALVVKKKNAEFRQMLKAEGGSREKSRRHEFEGRKLPCGVTLENGKFCVRIRHPELKKRVFFGRYSTCDEAAVVADRKRAELREVHRGEEVTGKLECSDEQTRDVKVPASVTRVRSGKPVATVKRVAVTMGYDGLNNSEIGEKLNCGVVDVPDKMECEFVQGSPTSNIEPGMSADKRVIEKESQRKTSGLEFDEAVRAGFINEYGQLVGKYRVLDEKLYLGLPDDIGAGSELGIY